MTWSLTAAAIDNIDRHIRVNAVCPSWVDTPNDASQP